MHRIGRTARAETSGDAFTFVSPDEDVDLRAIEREIGKRLPRITVPGFDYSKAPAERFEVPIAERIAAIPRAQGRGKEAREGEGRAADRAPHRDERPRGAQARAAARLAPEGPGGGEGSGPLRGSGPGLRTPRALAVSR